MADVNSGNRIKEFRTAQGLTVSELAARVGTTSATVSRLEGGTRGLDLDWMRRIALALGVRAADLIVDTDAVQFATLRGDLRPNKPSNSANSRLIPLPVNFDKVSAVDAFQTGKAGFVFAAKMFPAKEDRDRRFVVEIEHTTGRLLEIRAFEQDGPQLGFYSRHASPELRWLAVGDRRILSTWRIIAEFREETPIGD
jgi:transcriptional regulator with XRE-family HTH domain